MSQPRMTGGRPRPAQTDPHIGPWLAVWVALTLTAAAATRPPVAPGATLPREVVGNGEARPRGHADPEPRRSDADSGEISAEPDRQVVPGFPVWLRKPGSGSDRPLNWVVVVLEGLDLRNTVSAGDLMRRVRPAADSLREQGIDILVVDFPDGRRAPDELAPIAERAIRAAARVSQRTVAVLGVSSGGIVGRWALAQAEARGDPLPIHTFVTLDTPHQGFTFNPGLQAMAERYGSSTQRDMMDCPAVRALFQSRPAEVEWKKIGRIGPTRRVPARCKADTSGYDDFFLRLTHLTTNSGWPDTERCQVYVVSSASAHGPGGGSELVHVWLPFGADWTLKSERADRAPGALLPRSEMGGFSTRSALGLGGSSVRSAPTFLSTESALAAGTALEAPGFTRCAPRSDRLPALAHGEFDPDAAAYVGERLVKTFPTRVRRYEGHAAPAPPTIQP